ncbi:MAG TPA: alpha/beta fold hydrolase [Patescibacteria group bacterium]|nr:alpha/beta fold hydrolase [Patescibacteria group bacterium]
MKYEDGFHFNEYPCASGQPDALIIFLHGYGNHPDMFNDLPAAIHKEWPNADILVVRGPVGIGADKKRLADHGLPDAEDLYSWYKSDKSPEKNVDLALKHLFNKVPVVDELNRFADAQLAKRGLKDDGLVLYGFSLGGAMVVQMATRRSDKCAAVVAHSAPVFPIIKPKSKPETMLLMGDQDNYFYTINRHVAKNPKPRGRLGRAFDKALTSISVHYNASLQRLKRAGLPVEAVVVKGLHHTINDESFGKSVDFIVKNLRNKP